MTYEIANTFYLAHQTAFMVGTFIFYGALILGWIIADTRAIRRANRGG